MTQSIGIIKSTSQKRFGGMDKILLVTSIPPLFKTWFRIKIGMLRTPISFCLISIILANYKQIF